MTPPTETTHPIWLPPGKASTRLAVTAKTLQRWGDAGRITMIVLPTGHRRYLMADIDAIIGERQAS